MRHAQLRRTTKEYPRGIMRFVANIDQAVDPGEISAHELSADGSITSMIEFSMDEDSQPAEQFWVNPGIRR